MLENLKQKMSITSFGYLHVHVQIEQDYVETQETPKNVKQLHVFSL